MADRATWPRLYDNIQAKRVFSLNPPAIRQNLVVWSTNKIATACKTDFYNVLNPAVLNVAKRITFDVLSVLTANPFYNMRPCSFVALKPEMFAECPGNTLFASVNSYNCIARYTACRELQYA